MQNETPTKQTKIELESQLQKHCVTLYTKLQFIQLFSQLKSVAYIMIVHAAT